MESLLSKQQRMVQSSTSVSADYLRRPSEPEALAQVSRIRHHLHRYRSSFLSLSYIDGTGHRAESAYDIWINLCLITSKIRPTFLVQWIDYLDPSVYEKIMKLLVEYRDNMDPRDLDYRLLFLNDPQGIIVTTYYTYYKIGPLVNSQVMATPVASPLRELYAQYVRSNADSTILGIILGYPATGEQTLTLEDHVYMEKKVTQGASLQPPARYIYSIYVTTYGSGSKSILTNIYRSNESRNRLNDFYLKIAETVKLYDTDVAVTVYDSQPISDSRIAQRNHYIDFPREKIAITDSQRNLYNNFINSTDRQNDNWNDDFDRIFELGYIYNR